MKDCRCEKIGDSIWHTTRQIGIPSYENHLTLNVRFIPVEKIMDRAIIIITPGGWFLPSECTVIELDLDACPKWRESRIIAEWPEIAVIWEICLATLIGS